MGTVGPRRPQAPAPLPPPSLLAAGLPADLTVALARLLPDVRVQPVRSGAQALEALRGEAWSLLVLDSSLAGPAALEVLRRTRAEPRLHSLPVVYCLDQVPDPGLPKQLVVDLGVRRLLSHPLDAEQLAREAVAILGTRLPGDPPPTQETLDALAAVRDIWKRHRTSVLAQVGAVEAAVTAVAGGTLDGEQREEARRQAHKVAGSGGMFGFPEASRLARELELVLQSSTPLLPLDAPRLSGLVDRLRASLSEAPSPLEGARGAEQAQPLLLVVEDDEGLARALAAEAAGRGLRTQITTHVAAARAAVDRERPDVALLSLAVGAGAPVALDLLADLSFREEPVPVLVLTDSGDFADRVDVARLGGRGFLQKPLPPAAVIEAVTDLLARLRSEEAKVLVLDDDIAVLHTLEALLSRQGMSVVTSDDPLRFWQTLEEAAPDLLVLDVEMPHLSGIELCRVVRNDPRWSDLPVLFLTAHTDQRIISRLFAAGADDYVSKPIVGPELVTRITGRLERVRLYRSLADTDQLTGVATRRRSVQDLEKFLRLAARSGQPVCMAVLDLDEFKRVNDAHGHAAGDQVLRRLGGLLRRAFRGEDVVARWGGEEFVLGMLGMACGDGLGRVARLLETFRGEEFADEDGKTFRVTFSAGVAAYPEDGGDVQALYRSADTALYQAKAAGRDRVVPADRRPAAVSR